jgi:hypothetical protein
VEWRLVTYAAAVGGNGGKGMVAYAAEAVDCDGFFAGVDGAGAGVDWQAVEG